jgi:hypothetical protein
MAAPLVPDPVAIHNERMKLVASSINALGLALLWPLASSSLSW